MAPQARVPELGRLQSMVKSATSAKVTGVGEGVDAPSFKRCAMAKNWTFDPLTSTSFTVVAPMPAPTIFMPG